MSIGKLLISSEKLKSFTNINKNVDIEVIRAEIGIAQDLHLMPLLGGKFYYHLLDQIYATGNTFNQDELDLVSNFISPYLIQMAYYEMIPQLHYRTMNVGIVEPGGVEGGRNGVDTETMKYLRTIQRQRADFYMMRLQDYLIIGQGQGLFPDYNNFSTKDGITPMKSTKYSLPIVLNHTSRYGWAQNRYRNNGMSTYGEFDFLNPPCWGCQ